MTLLSLWCRSQQKTGNHYRGILPSVNHLCGPQIELCATIIWSPLNLAQGTSMLPQCYSAWQQRSSYFCPSFTYQVTYSIVHFPKIRVFILWHQPGHKKTYYFTCREFGIKLLFCLSSSPTYILKQINPGWKRSKIISIWSCI